MCQQVDNITKSKKVGSIINVGVVRYTPTFIIEPIKNHNK